MTTPSSSCPDCTHERELRELWTIGHERVHTLEKEALTIARNAVDRRLGEMNEMRAQITSERGTYVLREFYDEQHDSLRETVDGRLKALEQSKSNLEGRLWAVGAAVSVVVVLVNLAMRYFGIK